MRTPTTDEARSWWDRSADPDVRRAFASIYEGMARSLASVSPVCTASGRCCDFVRTGHDLFVTGLEAAVVLRGLSGGAGLDREMLQAARDAGSCPFLVGRACGIHAVRPSGCRSYFCDPTVDLTGAAEWAASEVRAIHERYAVAYLYAEWGRVLSAFVDAGLTRPPSGRSGAWVPLRLAGVEPRAGSR